MSHSELAAPYSIANDVYVCRRGSCYVVLDLGKNRYLTIEDHEATGLTRLVAGWPHAQNASPAHASQRPGKLLAELLAGNLVVRGMSQNAMERRLCVEQPASSLIDDSGPPMSPAKIQHVLAFARSFGRVRLNLRFRTAAYVSDCGRAWKLMRTRTSSTDISRLQELVGAFNSIATWMLTKHDNCLQSSFTLAEFLVQFRVFPSCVVGVRTDPFTAHCWLQHHDLVLNESSEYTRSLTPILVI